MEHIHILSSDSFVDNDTSLAMLYAVRPQVPTVGEDTRDEEAGGVAEGAPMPEERASSGSISPVRIFLDSGCLAGNYIREDIARRLVNKNHDFYTLQITNVCGAFGDCQLSKKKLRAKVKILEDNFVKEFTIDFKVLRNLPYEAIVGRTAMIIHRLTLPNIAPRIRPWEERTGHPALQAETTRGAHRGKIDDHLYARAEHSTWNQGLSVPLGSTGGSRAARA
jgi:hypothetical protein